MSKFKVGDMVMIMVYDFVFLVGFVVELECEFKKGDEIVCGFVVLFVGWIV